MNMLKQINYWLLGLLRRRDLGSDMNEEMRSHIEMQTRANIEAGMSPEEARYAAHRQFGWVESVKDACRDQRGFGWLDNLGQDIRHGARQLLRNPGFTLIAVLTLALGIGANTAIFSVVNGVLLRPLAYKDPDKIVTVLHGGWGPVSPADFLDWRAQARSFEALAAAEAWGGTMTDGDRPEAVSGIRMGEGLFGLLGVAPALGRGFDADDYLPGREPVLVLSDQLWRRRFGGNPEVIGRTVILDTKVYIVIGVMPREFRFAPFWSTRSEMWAPLSLSERAQSRDGNSLRIFGRLKAGVTRAQAQSEMDLICQRLEQAYPDSNKGRTVRVDALLDKVVGDIRQAIWVLAGAVGFVLLITCANVANLLLVRAAAREKEMAIRAAMGAGWWRTIRQLLTESLLLSGVAGVLGLLAGIAGVRLLKDYLQGNANSYQVRLPRVHEISVDTPTLLFTLAVVLAIGVLFGLAPAWQAASPELQRALKESGRGASAGRRGGRIRGLLVVTEVALAFMMLIGAGLLMRSFARLAAVDPGFNAKNVLSMTVSLAGQRDYTGPKREAFYRELLQKIGTIPGVESVSAVNHLPLAGDVWGRGINFEGRPPAAPGETVGAVYRVALPGYFSTMGMPLARGRDFNEQDRLETPGVAIINEEFARSHFRGEDPLGRRITLDDPRNEPRWLTIVGVARDVKQGSWAEKVEAEVYLAWSQTSEYVADTAGHFAYMTLVVRGAANPKGLIGGVREAVWSLNKSAPVSSVTTMEETMANAVWQQRFNLALMGIFAGLAFVLASVGIYGVMAYSVAQRSQEMGIRMALGARGSDLLKLVVGQGMRLAMAGLLIGLLGALALGRVVATLLYELRPTDALTYAVVSIGLAGSALLACWLPARRAARVDPMVVLRED